MGVTIPSLDPVTDILDTDKIMVTQSSGQTYTIDGASFNKRNQAVIANSTTLTGAPLKTGNIVRAYFTADITGVNTTTGLVLNYNGTNKNVKVPKNGALVNFTAQNMGGSPTVYKYLQAYTTLELLYDGTNFVIIGNPVVISSANYTIYAGGKIENKNWLVFEKSVDCPVGETLVDIPTRNCYMIVASGNNYGRGLWYLLKGYNDGMSIKSIDNFNLAISFVSFNQIKITNTSAGTINIRFYYIP